MKRFRIFLATGAALAIAGPSFGAETGAAFLKIDAGARAAGMGTAFTALADDASAIYWNPSGTAGISKRQVFLTHSEWLLDSKYEAASFAHPMASGALGFGVVYLSHGTLEGRGEDRKSSGNFAASDLAGIASLSRKMGPVSFGLNLKFIQQGIESEKAEGFAFDLGARMQASGSRFIWGAALQNLGARMRFLNDSYDLPLTLSGGMAYVPWKNLSLGLDVRRRIYTGDIHVGFGAEFWAFQALAIRTGYLSNAGSSSKAGLNFGGSRNGLNGLAGLGTGIGLKIFGTQVDYAFAPYGELGGTHQLSLTAGF